MKMKHNSKVYSTPEIGKCENEFSVSSSLSILHRFEAIFFLWLDLHVL